MSQKTTLVNLNTCPAAEKDSVYIGRGSIFGNPFSHLPSLFGVVKVDTREDAVASYRLWMTTTLQVPGWKKPTAQDLESLRGKKLGCFCSPAPCHGDVIIELLGEK